MKKLARLVCAILIISLLAIPMAGCSKPLTVSIYEPKDGITVSDSTVQVNGYVSDPKATVWLNDYVMTLTKYAKTASFTTTIELVEGENTITVTAARGKPDKWKDIITKTVTVTYSPQLAPDSTPPSVLSLEINSPEDGATITESPVYVSGSVSNNEAAVTVNGTEVEVGTDGAFSADSELTEGENVLTIVAALGEEALTRTLTVTYTPPTPPQEPSPSPILMEIISPEDGATLTGSLITVSGRVSDDEATVTVNGTEVQVGTECSFSADVELTEGENVITIIATLGEDMLTETITVTYRP